MSAEDIARELELALSCPFCGGTALGMYSNVPEPRYHRVRCMNRRCHIEGPYRKSEKRAILAWNKRP